MDKPDQPLDNVRGTRPPLAHNERLIVASCRIATHGDVDSLRLRQAVCAYVGELKAAGHTPEGVIIRVKGLLADAGIIKRGASTGDPDWTIRRENQVVDRVVELCIAEFFEPTQRRD